MLFIKLPYVNFTLSQQEKLLFNCGLLRFLIAPGDFIPIDNIPPICDAFGPAVLIF